jgi:hypothetical protein
MEDLVFPVLAVALFATSALYVRACAYLIDDAAADPSGPERTRR